MYACVNAHPHVGSPSCTQYGTCSQSFHQKNIYMDVPFLNWVKFLPDMLINSYSTVWPETQQQTNGDAITVGGQKLANVGQVYK